ncbi:MAG: hypothetical protein AB7S57_10255 [Acetobacteraceae bacterium]
MQIVAIYTNWRKFFDSKQPSVEFRRDTVSDLRVSSWRERYWQHHRIRLLFAGIAAGLCSVRECAPIAQPIRISGNTGQQQIGGLKKLSSGGVPAGEARRDQLPPARWANESLRIGTMPMKQGRPRPAPV